MVEQHSEFIRQSRVLSAETGQPDRELLVRHAECLVQMRTQRTPSIRIQP